MKRNYSPAKIGKKFGDPAFIKVPEAKEINMKKLYNEKTQRRLLAYPPKMMDRQFSDQKYRTVDRSNLPQILGHHSNLAAFDFSSKNNHPGLRKKELAMTNIYT